MTVRIEGGTVVTLDENNRIFNPGAVVVEGKKIKAIGELSQIKRKYDSADVLDATGKIIMPSFVNTHHHFYSTFARGWAPSEPTGNFDQVLENMWWKLDDALFREAIYYSAIVPIIESIKCGVTSVIDHHESQSYQIGSLDEISKAVEQMGIKGVLCLGASDRFGKGEQGLEENERFLRKDFDKIKGMVGLHASFTVDQETLEKSVHLAEKFNAGIHVHAAEGIADQERTREKYGQSVIERFHEAGALNKKSLLIHCIHIDQSERELIKAAGSSVVHNPESNMNNAVGYSKILDMYSEGLDVGIGTDGMSSDVRSQARTAFLLARHQYQDPAVAFTEVPDMLLNNNPKILDKITGWDNSKLKPGAYADIVTIDYDPATPINKDNFLGHFLFGMGDYSVDSTICDGEILMRHKKILKIKEEEVLARARETAKKVWENIE
ncbi:MAG: putative aminohydrolase SsnA [Elusimicrobiota bacterium]